MGRSWKLSTHHLRPRSRGGKDNKKNYVYLPRSIHRDWHSLFGNSTVMEAIKMYRKIVVSGGTWNGRKIISLCPTIDSGFRQTLVESQLAMFETTGGNVKLPIAYIRCLSRFFGILVKNKKMSIKFIRLVMTPNSFSRKELNRVRESIKTT